MKRTLLLVVMTLLMVLVLAPAALAADVAEVDGIPFDSLAGAFAAANDGDTVKLLDNTSFSSEIGVTSGNITLDLNGKTITAGQRIRINGGNLTVKDSAANGTILLPGDAPETSLFIVQKGMLIINSGTLISEYYGGILIATYGSNTDVANNCVITIGEDALLISESEYWSDGILIFPSSTNDKHFGIVVNVYGTIDMGTSLTVDGKIGAAINVNGNMRNTSGNVATINIDEPADITGVIYLAGYAKVNISGGTFIGNEALSIKAGDITISGGDFTGMGEYKNPPATNNSGTESTGACISITSNDSYIGDISMTISGGTFTSINGHAFYEGIAEKDGIAAASSTHIDSGGLLISGGDFDSADGLPAVLSEEYWQEYSEPFISGGTFSTNPSIYADDSFQVIVDRDGNYVVGSPSAPTKGSIIKFAEKAETPEPVLPFSDIAKHWAKDDILFMADKGYMTGTAAGVFSPDMPISRAMFVTILGRIENVDTAKYPVAGFDDVVQNSYYAAYVEWAAQSSVVTGYNEGLFGPDDAITREQLAVILYRYAELKDYNIATTKLDHLAIFSDGDTVSDYARVAMNWAIDKGIISGRTDGTLDPDGTATRAEVAAMMHRFIELFITAE